MTPEVVSRAERMLTNGATLHQIATVLEVSVKTLYRYIPAVKQQRLRDSVLPETSKPLKACTRPPELTI